MVVPLFLLTVALVALAQSWNRWLDPVIDAGRDLYIPGALLEGKKLYRDVLYFYPPLTPYLLAALNLLSGRSLAAYTAIGILISAVVAWQLWRIGRETGGPEVGGAAAFLFLTLSLAGASTWGCNFIFPYAHAATLGTMFVLLFLASGIGHVSGKSSWRSFAFAVLSGAAAALTKVEFALLVAVSAVVIVILRPPSRRALLAAGTFAAALVAGVSLLFADAPAGQHWLRDQVFSPALLQGTRHFYGVVSGAAAMGANLREVILSAGIILLLVFGLRIVDRLAARHRLVGEVLFVAVAAAALLLPIDHALFRAWALFQVALLPLAWKRRDDSLLLLLVVSILSTWRVLLRLSPDWYGFFLVVPAYLAIPYVLIRYLPLRGVYTPRSGLLWLPVMLLVGAQSLAEQREMYALKRHAVKSPHGITYDAIEGRAAILNAAIAQISRSGARTLMVIPEGLTLNYFTGKENPTPFHTFTPAEIDPNAERRAIAALQSAPPELIVLLSRDMAEFGSRGFGVDYGQDLLGHVLGHFRPVGRWRSETFELVLLRRR